MVEVGVSQEGGAAGKTDLRASERDNVDRELQMGRRQPIWEMELLQNQLVEMRLALDRERRLRLLLEDQIRTLELSRLQVSTSDSLWFAPLTYCRIKCHFGLFGRSPNRRCGLSVGRFQRGSRMLINITF